MPGGSFLGENGMPEAALRVGGPKSPKMCRKVQKYGTQGSIWEHFGALWGLLVRLWTTLGTVWTSTCGLQALFFSNVEGKV